MSEFKEGDKAWVVGVFTKTKHRNKMTALVSEVTINKFFDDNTCLVTDPEDIGMYIYTNELIATKLEAAIVAVKGIDKWNDHKLTDGEQHGR